MTTEILNKSEYGVITKSRTVDGDSIIYRVFDDDGSRMTEIHCRKAIKDDKRYCIQDYETLFTKKEFESSDGIIMTTIKSDEILHREDGPAVSHFSHKLWFVNGKLHREDGPAVILGVYSSQRTDFRVYYRNGILHREDGPAIGTYKDDKSIGYESYYRNGLLHREDGPALTKNRKSFWYINGELVKSCSDPPSFTFYFYKNGYLTHRVMGENIVHYKNGERVSLE